MSSKRKLKRQGKAGMELKRSARRLRKWREGGCRYSGPTTLDKLSAYLPDKHDVWSMRP